MTSCMHAVWEQADSVMDKDVDAEGDPTVSAVGGLNAADSWIQDFGSLMRDYSDPACSRTQNVPMYCSTSDRHVFRGPRLPCLETRRGSRMHTGQAVRETDFTPRRQ